MIIAIVALLVIVGAGVLLRSSLLLRYKWAGKDTFYHLMVGEIIRRGRALPKNIDRFVEPEEYCYPPLLHVLISAFPRRLHSSLQFLAPICDGIVALILFALCVPVFGDAIALLVVGLFLFTPYAVDISFFLSPRSPANLLFFIAFLCAYVAVADGSSLYVVFAVLSTSSVFLLHRLTTQSIVVVLIMLSLVSLSPVPLIIVIASVALSIILTGGFYIKVLKGHLSFVVELTRRMRGEGFNPRTAFPSPIFLLYNVPLLILIIPALLWPLPDGGVYGAALMCSIGLLILSVTWIWGEGRRHLSNAAPLLAIVGGVWMIRNGLTELALLFLAASAIISIYKLRRIALMTEMAMILPQEVVIALEHISSRACPGEKILSLPLDFTYAAGYFTGLTMVQGSGGSAKGLCYNDRIHGAVANQEYDALVLEFNVRWILVYDRDISLNVPYIATIFGNKVTVLEVIDSLA